MAKAKETHAVLARKYRPQGFEEVVGQPAVSVTLKNALSTGRLHHAYLFTGPRGVGKTTMARILAKALNCKNGPTPEPCDACDPCREITISSSLDVLEMDAASNTGVDNVRQVIIETVALAPSRDRYKVFIIDETHMLSTAAFNALLKTLEEPPAHVVFILATTEIAKVPATIASRCQRFKFRPVAVELLAQHLANLAKKEKLAAEPAALELLARSAEGSLRDAVSLLDQCRSAGGEKVTEELVRDMFGFVPQDLLVGVLAALLSKDAPALAGWIKKLHAEGIEPAQLLRDLRSAAEALYLEKLGLEPATDKALRALSAQGTAEGFSFILRRLNKTLEDLRFGDSPRLILELGLFGCLEAAGDLEVWVKRLEDLERRLASGAAAPSAAPQRGYTAPPPTTTASAAPPPTTATGERVSRSVGERRTEESHDSSPAVAGSLGEAWRRAIELVAAEKPALGASLEAARFVPGEGVSKVFFGRSFDCEGAKRHQALVEAKLATAAGKTVKLSFDVGSTGQPGPTELVQRSVEPAPPGASTGDWSDAREAPKEAPKGAGASKAEQILGGKMRIVKKPAP
jgi:DNA polymerase-3 subunit gamma/tau